MMEETPLHRLVCCKVCCHAPTTVVSVTSIPLATEIVREVSESERRIRLKSEDGQVND
jgi:hypothetical protein